MTTTTTATAHETCNVDIARLQRAVDTARAALDHASKKWSASMRSRPCPEGGEEWYGGSVDLAAAYYKAQVDHDDASDKLLRRWNSRA